MENSLSSDTQGTGRMQTPEAQLQLYADIVARMKTGIYVYRLDDLNDDWSLRMINANPASAALLGLKVSDLLGKKIDEIFPNLRLDDIPRHFADVVRTGEPYENESYSYTDHNISVSYFSFKAFPLPDQCVCILFENITERKKAEKALLESEQRFRKTFDQSPIGAAMISPDFRFLRVNEAFCNIIGYTPEELKQMTFADITHPDHADHDKYMVSLILKGDVEQYVTDKRYIRKDGLIVWAHVSVGFIKDDIGNPLYFLPIIEDITQRKRTEEDLRRSQMLLREQNEEYLALNEELSESNERIRKINSELIEAKEKAEEADRLKTAFLANMSHEIRTPMNGIMGYADLLTRPEFEPEKKIKFSEIIKRSGKQLLRIISDILDISKIESNQMVIHNEQVCINLLLNNILEFYLSDSSNIENRDQNITIKLNTGLSDEESTLFIDASRLEQIIVNLIDNAYKYTSQGSIEFGYSLNEDKIEFYVSDTGMGIPPEKQSIIFERFRQGEESLSRVHRGNGLGLSICMGLAKLMGGNIWVNSEVNKGSTFYVSLPYTSLNNPYPKKNKKMNQGIKDLSGKVVLIVEDDEFSATYLEEILSPANFSVIQTKSGTEAIEICRKNTHVDIVLMDIRLPDMNGLEATRHIKAIKPEIPIVAQTANAMPDDQANCLAAGCNDYISKPINAAHLFEILYKYL